MVNSNDRMMSCRLSKSGKAVLVYTEEGEAYMTSVAYMRMLIDGKARNNMIALRAMGGAKTDHFNQHLIKDVKGDPMSHSAVKQRSNMKIENGDW